jgi:broad specificity phosphatase PhoE
LSDYAYHIDPLHPGQTFAPRPPVALVLVRHGRTAWNAERRFLGSTDLPLDEIGRSEAEALGRSRAGQFTAIWSSPLRRALETAAVLRPPEVEVERDLREIDLGLLEGLTGEEASARYPEFSLAFRADPVDVRPPGGETMAEVRDRAMAAILRLAARHTGGARVAVVTHQVVIASVVCTLRGDPLSAWRTHAVPNTGAVELVFDGSALCCQVSGFSQQG